MPEPLSQAICEGLNEQQLHAVGHGDEPLLIIAGAGTGKTTTLVHRVAALIERGIDPARILLLTFSRRAAAEMSHRAAGLLARLAESGGGESRSVMGKVWGGTFHATSARLLRTYGAAIGLNPSFTIHDRTDSEDFIGVLCAERKMPKSAREFPKKEMLLAIYSHCVNAQLPLQAVLERQYPAYESQTEALTALFQLYMERKQQSQVLDYDDLLLYWLGLLDEPEAGRRVRQRFDAILVDEYQDTNRLQSEILRKLRPDGRGMTVVGDDAQSIYSFRAATVRNILDFPEQFPGTTIVKLEQNYRSVQPILDATNAVIALSRESYAKRLWSERNEGDRPCLVTCWNETEQADYVAGQIQQRQQEGTPLKCQAVLFRASHQSAILEMELTQRRIPFVKYGGLRFVEAAHVKDVVAFLRLAENYRDLAAGVRVLQLLPGIGPRKAMQMIDLLTVASGDLRVWRDLKTPSATRTIWPKFVKLMNRLGAAEAGPMASQIKTIITFYRPLLEDTYDNADVRLRDLEQLQQLAERFSNRGQFITDLALDPPNSHAELGRGPKPDDDFLVLSTVHSAKGLEWDAVFVISATDGTFPFSRAQHDPEQIEEERRLFYVALTPAKQSLHVICPQQTYFAGRNPYGDPYMITQLTRFIAPSVKKLLRELTHGQVQNHSPSPFWQAGARERFHRPW